jgi:hypothetical protein
MINSMARPNCWNRSRGRCSENKAADFFPVLCQGRPLNRQVLSLQVPDSLHCAQAHSTPPCLSHGDLLLQIPAQLT